MARRLAAERFIGRADLLELFDEMLASSHEGRGDVLLIGGEAGVGKSRAIAELTSRAQRDGAVVLVGWCVENGEQILPLAPVADILRDIATLFNEAEFDQIHWLGRRGAWPAGTRPGRRRPTDGGEPRSSPRRLFDGMLDALRALSNQPDGG